MKKMMIAAIAALTVTTAFCAGARKRGVQAMAGNEDGPSTSGREAKVTIDRCRRPDSPAALARLESRGRR